MLLIVSNIESGFKKTGFIMYLIVGSAIRLAVLLYYGQLVSGTYERLLWRIRARLTPSTLNWLYWNRLRSLQAQLRLTLYSIVTLEQALTLSLVNFMLSYIVLLTQTDYSGNGPKPNEMTLNVPEEEFNETQ